jgi:hypothetical protein
MELARASGAGTCQIVCRRPDPADVIDSLEISLERAFDRFADFVAVQGERLSPESVELLQEALGIGDGARSVLAERLRSDFQDDFAAAQVLLGLILGVSAAQLAAEARSSDPG